MKTVIVELSDRKNARRVQLQDYESGSDAVRKVVGSRLINERCAEWNNAGDAIYECMVSTGPTRNGSTPFKNIRAYVSNA